MHRFRSNPKHINSLKTLKYLFKNYTDLVLSITISYMEFGLVKVGGDSCTKSCDNCNELVLHDTMHQFCFHCHVCWKINKVRKKYWHMLMKIEGRQKSGWMDNQ